jgi:hypothetical protein
MHAIRTQIPLWCGSHSGRAAECRRRGHPARRSKCAAKPIAAKPRRRPIDIRPRRDEEFDNIDGVAGNGVVQSALLGLVRDIDCPCRASKPNWPGRSLARRVRDQGRGQRGPKVYSPHAREVESVGLYQGQGRVTSRVTVRLTTARQWKGCPQGALLLGAAAVSISGMNEPAIRIFVDADACPVKEEVWWRTGLGSRAMIEAFSFATRGGAHGPQLSRQRYSSITLC